MSTNDCTRQNDKLDNTTDGFSLKDAERETEQIDHPHERLSLHQKLKLNQFFDHIVYNIFIDFDKQEMKDIQSAVLTMLERIVERLNKRGVFNISSIYKCGSTAEKTSIWKFDDRDETPFIEFDFVATLRDFVEDLNAAEEENVYNKRWDCPGCIGIFLPPVEIKQLQQHYPRKDGVYNNDTLKDKRTITNLFLKEINWCLTSSCNCLSITFKQNEWDHYEIRFQPTSYHPIPDCDKCFVDMSTGTLRVNTTISIKQGTKHPNRCSLVFLWTSKARTLAAPDKFMLNETQHVTSLPIYVDFLPVLESRKHTDTGNVYEHANFIVPKHCNMCKDYRDYWKKSWCMAEVNVFTNVISGKHKTCYRIMKCLLQIAHIGHPINNYHVKTVVLLHDRTCSDATDDYVDCVIKMFEKLQRCYKVGIMMSPLPKLNILSRFRYFEFYGEEIEKLLKQLCDVSITDTWSMFVKK